MTERCISQVDPNWDAMHSNPKLREAYDKYRSEGYDHEEVMKLARAEISSSTADDEDTAEKSPTKALSSLDEVDDR